MRDSLQGASEQLTELKAGIGHVEMAFLMEFNLEPGLGIKPDKLGELLEPIRRQWQADLNQQRHDMRILDDAAATKRWLKHQRQLLREAELDFELF